MWYPKCDLHVHTTFCDGADEPETVVCRAIEMGLEVLGFSGHSPVPFECGTMRDPDAYRQEIARLREAYRGQLRIFCGVEQDWFSGVAEAVYDYVIGSVHTLRKNGEYLPVDGSEETLRRGIRELFGGDVYAFLRAYYETVAGIADRTGCDVVGHFDLPEKFNRGGQLYDAKDPRVRRIQLDVLDALLARDLIFEINTGAMSRGYREVPYPSAYLLRRIAEKRGRVTLTSDAHRAKALLYRFSDAARLAASCGIGGFTVLTPRGWETLPLRSGNWN